ncbi:DNA-directed RNA polymerase II subunit RPB1-like [Temnothorax curvispinosus]|uniref:DNA-directed RNA polymerase II subunit RPB1-like n=1 Tax=Temnothorax curvispinosus TaxID=300111 RepID=A0A6J1PSY1_9HYME|nr:DNA-directed RNA polymerase II subunit RPB1-like [Temnothorax curvispinosus]
MRVNVILVFVALVLGLVDAARRRDRLRTSPTTTTPSLIDRQFAFAGQPEELELSLWNNFDSHKLNVRAGTWKNDTSGNNRIVLNSVRQYPGFPSNPGDTNELPNPISPPVQPAPPPYKPPPGCLGPRGQYSSPKNCANYLNCWDDVVIEQTCPAGLLFNDVAGYCDFAYNVKCGDRPPATPKPALPAGSKLCPDPNGRYRSSTNCSEFYVCAAGKPIKFYCPLGLVYSDILNVCDYQRNVDCKGAATPRPLRPTQPPTQSPQSSSTYAPINPPTPSKPPIYPPQPPTYQPQQPTYAPQPTYSPKPPSYQPQQPTYQPQQPTYQPQPPTYQPQPPTYQPQPPTYQPQQPTYAPQPTYSPKPPSYQPQPSYPSPPVSYPGNPWLNKGKSDPWHQRNLATELEIDKEIQKQDISTDSPALGDQPTQHDVMETSSLANPWTLHQEIPSELLRICNNGEVYKLNDFCTKVIVCKSNKPEVVDCPSGLSYDVSSDSCKPFNIAVCNLESPTPSILP